MKPYHRHVFVCTNERPPDNPKGSCKPKGGEEVRERFKTLIKERGIRQVRANAAGCLDQCASGCVVVVYPEAVWYGQVTPDDVEEIVTKHLEGGEPVERLRIDQPR